LDAGFSEAEAGHDFVEDEECAELLGDACEKVEVAGLGEDEAGVGGVGFDDDGGDEFAFFLEEGGEGFGVVVREDEGVFGEVLWHTGGVGFAVGEGTGAGGDEEGIAVAVVAAVEFDDQIALGETAGEADGGHGGLGAGVAHADPFDRGNPVGDGARHFDFVGIRNAEGDAVFGDFVDGVGDDGGGVAEDVRAPGADVVDVGFAIDVGDAAAFGTADEERLAADVAEGADGGVDAAGDEGFGGVEKLLRDRAGGHGGRVQIQEARVQTGKCSRAWLRKNETVACGSGWLVSKNGR